MSEGEIKDAINSLLILWRDEEWWEEQGLSQVRPTLKAAADAARQLTGERDEWKKAAFEITEQANKTRDNLTEERDIARADLEKVVTYNTRLQDEREKLRVEVERLKRELEQTISERTPHDYGILRNQRDDYRDRLCTSIKETQEARAEVEQLKQALHDARLENSGQAALIEQCREEYRVAHLDRQHYKRIAEHRQKELSGLLARPEPSRLEIAAMLQAGWLANPESEIDNQHDWWLAQAEALIAAAKGGAE